MTRFPNSRPARLAGLESCLEHSVCDHRPRWSLFWRLLALGLTAFLVAGGATIALLALAGWS